MKFSIILVAALANIALAKPEKNAGKSRATCDKFGSPRFESSRDVCSADADATLQSFLFSTAATTAWEPNGYDAVFIDLSSIVDKKMALLLTSDKYTTYDPSACAARCNTIPGCLSFNIYFERDSSLDSHKPVCTAACTRVRCAYYSAKITADDATCDGQTRGHKNDVVYAGSNGYNQGCQIQKRGGNSKRVVDGCQQQSR